METFLTPWDPQNALLECLWEADFGSVFSFSFTVVCVTTDKHTRIFSEFGVFCLLLREHKTCWEMTSSPHLLNTYYVPGIELSKHLHFCLQIALDGTCHYSYSYFTDVKVECQGGEVICPKLHGLRHSQD